MKTANVHAFGTLLKQYRSARALTQEALAERAGISVRTIKGMERGEQRLPRGDTLTCLISALQLLPHEDSALRSAARGIASPRNPQVGARDVVPLGGAGTLTSLIGREDIIQDTLSLLSADETRLLTLVGPPGVGKTRIGLEIAQRVADSAGRFADQVECIALTSVQLPALVLPTIARAMGVHEAQGQPLLDSLTTALHGRRTLLFLDNFEHLLAAAPDLISLLIHCPDVKVLITSRAALRIRAEREIPIPPLAVPAPPNGFRCGDTSERTVMIGTTMAAQNRRRQRRQRGSEQGDWLAITGGTRSYSPEPLTTDRNAPQRVEDLRQVPAVALFLQRTRATLPSFALDEKNAPIIAEICRQVDGLPLAIELAAARLRVLPPPQLLTLLEHRLRVLTGGPQDLPARQQTLRSTLAWSYDLLPTSARILFRRLATFVGGCTLDAAETVCGTAMGGSSVEREDILDGLTMLVDHSLLRYEVDDRPDGGTSRFTMLATLREYGQEHLAGCGEADAMARAHATYFLALAEEAERQLKGPEQAQWYRQLEREHGNLRAALHWAVEAKDSAIGLRLGAALWRFWQHGGHLTEGWSWLEALLALTETGDATSPALAPVRATVLMGAGALAQRLRHFRRAEELLTQGLDLRRGLGDTWGVASAFNNLGGLAFEQEDYACARQRWQESLTRFRAIGDSWATALLLNNLGFVMAICGESERALALYAQSQQLQTASGDILGIATTLDNQAEALRMQGNLVQAMSLSEESLRHFRALGATSGIAHALTTLANIVRQHGDYARAEALSNESITLLNELQDISFLVVARATRGAIARDQHDDAAALAHYRESLVLSHSSGGKRGMVACLEGLAEVVAHRGEIVLAVRLCSAAHGLRHALGTPLPVADRPAYEALLAAARATLDDDGFAEAWKEGGQMPVEEMLIVALAMESGGGGPGTASVRQRISAQPGP